MKLFIIHCGFYDEEISDGIYEFHVNIPVAANNIDEAKTKIRNNFIFQSKKMHIDGIQELNNVDGFKLELKLDESSKVESKINSHRHRDL